MTHNNNGQEWWLQVVPSDSEGLHVEATERGCLLQVTTSFFNYTPTEVPVTPPSGTWQIHSDSTTITEEQAAEIVRQIGVMYEDYEYPEDFYFTAILSYASLLRSLGLEGKRIINLKKI